MLKEKKNMFYSDVARIYNSNNFSSRVVIKKEAGKGGIMLGLFV